MRSLFAKIFLSFLLIIVLIATIGILLTYLRDQEFPPLANQHFVRQALGEYGRGAMSAYETGGPQGLEDYSRKLFDEAGIQLLLFDAQGRPLTRRRVPPRMQHMAQRALQTGELVLPRQGPRNWLASQLQNAAGQTYIVAIGLPGQPSAKQLARGIGHGSLGWRLLVLLGVSALVCFWLARSVTAPIGRLRQATRQFAAGNLATRVAGEVKGRDEIAGLARDFDEMAGQIESLVGAQQRLLRDISHELRSPLARLRVALELARQSAAPAAQDKALARIEGETERMNQLIGQLLSLTQLETAAGELQKEPFDLCELLDTLVQDADFEAQQRGCAVRLEAAGPVLLMGSQQLLAQAFENVIRNAVKYTAPGSCVSVALDRRPQAIEVQIADQGPGVPEEALMKLFEPFYRVADARDRQSGGTGIGLAIAERAVSLHGGRIRAENRSQGGLLVRIDLPL